MMLDQEMIREFIEEVEEHLRTFETAGLALEKDPENADLINDLFRSAHSIKGAAGYMGFERIAELSHKIESLMELFRSKSAKPGKELVEILFRGLDRIRKLTTELSENGSEESEIADLITLINDFTDVASGKLKDDNEPRTDSSRDHGHQSPSDIDSDEELKEIYIQQAGEYVTQLCQLMADIKAEVDPRASIWQMTSVVTDFIQLASYIKQESVKNILETLVSSLKGMHKEESIKTAECVMAISKLLKDLINCLPSGLPVEKKLLDSICHADVCEGSVTAKEAEGKVPERDEGLFAFPLEDSDRSLLDDFNEFASGDASGAKKETDAEEFISEEMIAEALAGGDIEEEIFQEKSGGQQVDTSREEEIESTEFEEKSHEEKCPSEADKPIIIDEDAVVCSIEKKFTDGQFNEPDEKASEDGEHVISEEYDQELFEIFLNAFLDNMRSLVRISDALEAGRASSPVLENAVELLDKMISSANYMDYQHVIRILKDWRQDLTHLITSGKDASEIYGKMLSDYTDKLYKIIPQLAEIEKDQLIEFEEEPVDLSEVSSASAEVEVKIDKMFDFLDTSGDKSGDESHEVQLSEKSQKERISPPEIIAPSDEQKEEPTGDGSSDDVPAGLEEKGETGEDFLSLTELVSKQTLRVDAQKVDNLLNQVGELVVTRAGFSQTADYFRELIQQFSDEAKLEKQDLKLLRSLSFRLNESSVSLGRVANELQEAVMKIRMLPVHHLFQRFPRLVRNQSKQLDKKVRLEISGSDTELDKRVLEQMADPLVHLLRNAIAHGIEDPQDRMKSKKPEEGTISLAAYHEGNHVILEVSDDGKGIDVDRLREALKQRGIIATQDIERLNDKEVVNSIFLPGVSTNEYVDKASGRGVGMDVVKKNVERLNGTVEVHSEFGCGTRFVIKIPLTVAIIQALLVEVSGQIFTIPLTSVLEITRVFEEEVETIEGFEVIHLRDTTIPLLRLEQIFHLSESPRSTQRTFVVIVNVGPREVGLIVDSLLGEQEVVIKPLTENLRENKGFSGATILGDGSISLILDVGELIKLVRGRSYFGDGKLTAVA